jgi:hypothetical protein
MPVLHILCASAKLPEKLLFFLACAKHSKIALCKDLFKHFFYAHDKLLHSLTSIENYKEAQKDKNYKQGPTLCKENPGTRHKMRSSPQLLPPPCRCRLCEGLQRRHRGRTTWSAAQGKPTSRAAAAAERQPYCL